MEFLSAFNVALLLLTSRMKALMVRVAAFPASTKPALTLVLNVAPTWSLATTHRVTRKRVTQPSQSLVASVNARVTNTNREVSVMTALPSVLLVCLQQRARLARLLMK